jgi:hypothetical protein
MPMKGFFLRLATFLAPLFCLIAPSVLMLWLSGERFCPLDPLLAGNKRYLVGYDTHEGNYGYMKWRTITLKPRPEVLAIGSSRVLQFRSEMFRVPYYNAGYTVNAIADYQAFIQSIPREKRPKTLLLQLDQWMFGDAHSPPKVAVKPVSFWRDAFQFWAVGNDCFTASRLLCRGDVSFRMIREKKTPVRIGLSAYMNDSGMRNDGSMSYGARIVRLEHDTIGLQQSEFENTFHRVATGTILFEYGAHANLGSIAALENLLRYCKRNKIDVVGFLPPLPDAVWRKIEKTGKYGYMREIDSLALPVFRRYGFDFFDFGMLKSVGGADGEMLDGFHGSEVTAARMLLRMSENPAISRAVDRQKLLNALDRRTSNFRLYPN